jgi:hypothetical protein
MSDTQELIARLEAATGPDRDIDRAIAKMLGVMPLYELRGQIGGSWPDYTASIDAALTLMPELWNYVIGSPGIEETELDKWCVNIAMHPDDRGDLTFAPTPALAICIAALKARNQTDD